MSYVFTAQYASLGCGTVGKIGCVVAEEQGQSQDLWTEWRNVNIQNTSYTVVESSPPRFP